MRKRRISVMLAALASSMVVSTVLVSAGGVAQGASSAPGVTAKTIKIGYITSLTGVASSSFADGEQGVLAAVDAQNAKGGVNGRKIQVVSADDQSSPAQFLTAAQDLVSNKNVFGVIPFSSFTFGGVRYFQQQGVPVVGNAFDGYEWYDQPYSNMFNDAFSVSAEQSSTFYTYTLLGKMLKAMGVTKLGVLAYGISPSSQASVKAAEAAAKKFGISTCYENLSVPFGGVDFTADVLQIKAAGCNGVIGSFVDASDIALATALKQGGYTGKQMYYTGYDQNVLSSASATAALDGAYLLTQTYFNQTNSAVKTMFANLRKYAKGYKGGLPDFGLAGSYLATQTMIKGLQAAGKNPTRASFIKNFRKVSNFNPGGLLPSPTSFTNFGTPKMFPPTMCYYLLQLKGGQFTPAAGGTGGKFCGTKLTF